MDSNAKSRVWYSNVDDERGNQLNDFIALNNLIIMNDNQDMATYHTTHGESFIDLTLINTNSAVIITDWCVLADDSLSDHRYIAFNIGAQCQEVKYKSTIKYNTCNADWDSFENQITAHLSVYESQIESITDENQLNYYIDSLMKIVLQVCDNTIPKIKNNGNTRANRWWCQQLTQLRRQTNSARRRYQRCQTDRRDQLEQEYLRIKHNYKQTLNRSKIDSWNHFVDISTRGNPWGLIYKISKNQLNSEKVNELISADGYIIHDNKDIARTLLDSFFPTDNTDEDNAIHSRIRAEAKIPNTEENDIPFTTEEITTTIDSQNENKAPGEDGITADIIKKLHSINNSVLTKLYNKCLQLMIFPQCWRSAVIKVIRKPNKEDYRQTSSYRPISLISVFGKIYEKLIISRIMHFLRINQQLSDKQYGFTPQTSTEDALHSLINFIKDAFQRKGFALIISADIDGAFNNNWWPKIINKLRLKKCPKNLFYVSKSYFSSRTAKLWYQNEQEVRTLNVGCPQGSVCGPHYWNLSYDNIFSRDWDEQVINEAFADDTRVMIFAQTIQELEIKANKAIEELVSWANENKLKFNPLKTECVLFTRKLKYNQPKVFLHNQQLKISTTFKHLGIYIDSKLRWKTHANYITSKAQQLIMKLISFAKNKYGLSCRALETIYKGAVLPIVSYASSVWFEAIDSQFVKKPLITLQRRVAIRMIKGYKTISIEAANILANLIPIDLYLKKKSADYFVKRGINNILTDSLLEDYNIDLNYIQRPFKADELPHFALRKSVKIVSESTDDIIAYTDGSKSEEGVGSGFCILKAGIIIKKAIFKLAKHCSVFQSEMFAILKAVQYINTKAEPNETITICSDSLSSITALKNPNSTTY
jgi:hypothetical protein